MLAHYPFYLALALALALCGPGPRVEHGLAYDSVHQQVVLFGGSATWSTAASLRADGAALSQPLGDTWRFDGQAWSRVETLHAPSPRAGHTLAFDRARGRLVLFGGASGLDDTWEFDGQDWAQIQVAQSPPARTQAALCYDLLRGVCVLYGGLAIHAGGSLTPTLPLSDTWEYGGRSWQRVETGSYPAGVREGAGLARHGMAYDEARRSVLLFGGSDGVYDSGNTWSYDGRNWRQIESTLTPFPRRDAGMAYDARRGSIILYGGAAGRGASEQVLGDTYAWTGEGWELIATAGPQPGPRRGHALAGDVARGSVVLYGGATGAEQAAADTWVYKDRSWAWVYPFGRGCVSYLPMVASR